MFIMVYILKGTLRNVAQAKKLTCNTHVPSEKKYNAE